MKHKINLYKRVSLILGITTLLLGLMPLSALGGVGLVSADDGEVPDPPAAEEPMAEEPAAPPAEEPPAEELVEEPLVEEPLVEEPLVEEPLVEEPVEEELLMMSSVIGDDPNIANELPDFGNNYSNGDCVTNTACETDEPVTNPNEYTDKGGYGEKVYVLPEINGNTADIVAIKKGNDWFFFKKGSGETCAGDFCVEFDDQGNVSVYSYNTQGNGYAGFNMIHFWVVGEDPDPNDDILGCTDRTAKNFNPQATKDDGSCEYDDPGDDDDDDDPGGPGGGTPDVPPVAAGGPDVIIPVTGQDLGMPFAGLQRLMMFAGMMFFGMAITLEGLDRKFNK